MIAGRMTLVLLILVCGLYPAAVWAVGQIAFRHEANGSLIERDGRVIGSSLIGQAFATDGYFHPRPSAVDFNAQASGGSNLGPTSQKLRDRIGAGVKSLGAHVPPDAVTTSASGLDPHISPEYAQLQVARVARARAADARRIQALVDGHVERRFLGVYGEPRVNVLLLNIALDDMMRGDGTRK